MHATRLLRILKLLGLTVMMRTKIILAYVNVVTFYTLSYRTPAICTLYIECRESVYMYKSTLTSAL